MKFTANNTLDKVADTLMNTLMLIENEPKDGEHSPSKSKPYGGLFSNYFSKMASLPDLRKFVVEIEKNKESPNVSFDKS